MKNQALLIFVVTLFCCAPKKIVIGKYSTFLVNEMNELELYIEDENVIKTEISSVKVGWHIEHILLTINEIYKSMESSNPDGYKKRVNLTKMMMFAGNQIPRGKAKAPQVVQPKNEITTIRISSNYELAKTVLQKFDALDKNAYFKHPSAGYLNKEDAKRFLKIHTEHHLKIIRDILNIETTNTSNK